MRATLLFFSIFMSTALPFANARVNASGDVVAASEVSINPAASASDVYEGIVIDQTVTRSGRDFFRNFVSSWRDQPLSDRYTLSVREHPSARHGSQIAISYNMKRVFQGNIPPNAARIKSLSDSAVETVYRSVTEGEMQRLLFKDPDLGKDEL